MALITSKPVKAFSWQNHMAHIQTHMNFLNDPGTKSAIGQNPLGPSIVQATWAHLNEHLAYAYRAQIEQKLGAPLPPLGSHLPADAENELSGLVQAASDKLLAANQAEDQQKQQQQQQQDPILQQAQAEFQLKQQQVQSKTAIDAAKLQLQQQQMTQKGQIEAARLASQEQRDLLRGAREDARHHASEIAETHRAHAKEHAETTRHLMTTRVDREKNLNEAHQKAMDSVLEHLPAEGGETAPAPSEAPPEPVE